MPGGGPWIVFYYFSPKLKRENVIAELRFCVYSEFPVNSILLKPADFVILLLNKSRSKSTSDLFLFSFVTLSRILSKLAKLRFKSTDYVIFSDEMESYIKLGTF